MIYAFDLDDTLCIREDGVEHLGVQKYQHCKPIPEMVKKVNDLYKQGHTIYIYTARGMSQFKGNINEIHNQLYVLTLNSLKEWNINHHGLIMGKLHYDFLIDDKAIGQSEFDKFIKES
jgi:hydroxymethylpyrimidine pyrophosphatase-like HAD family hydrolase